MAFWGKLKDDTYFGQCLVMVQYTIISF
jgi:hypothetical protein